MKRHELRACTERLARECGLRWLKKSKRYIGVHRGMIVDLAEWEGEVTFNFSSPTAELADEAAAGFTGFTHLAGAGIPAEWIKGVAERDGRGNVSTSNSSCRLLIDTHQIDAIGLEAFEQIPSLAAADFLAHGASETLGCVECGEKAAQTVGLLNYAHTPLCNDCWQDLQFRTSGGKLATQQTVRWIRVLPALAALTVLGSLIWGFVQQPEHVEHLGQLTMIGPCLWAIGLCRIVVRVSGGVTRALRISLFVSVAISVLAGNIWGFRSFAIEQFKQQGNQIVIGPGWMESVHWYFSALPNNWQGEAPFFLCGALGAWVGLRFLKRAESIDVQ